jgi:hypothetical protein
LVERKTESPERFTDRVAPLLLDWKELLSIGPDPEIPSQLQPTVSHFEE